MCILSSLFPRKQSPKPEPPPTTWTDRVSLAVVGETFDAAYERAAELSAYAPTFSTRDICHIAAGVAVGAVLCGLGTKLHTRYFKRIEGAEWLTPTHLSRKQWIKGRVVSVGDADNFRLYHTPGIGWATRKSVPDTAKGWQKKTIHIRLAGVDAPEGAHFGKTAQEHYPESLQWLRDQILGKIVYCQLYSRDQYMRVVAMPYLPPRHFPGVFTAKRGTCLSAEMLRAGWAVVYEQGGAQYGSYTLEQLKAIEEEARSAKRGIWVSGFLKETPAAYKKRTALGVDAAEKGESADDAPEEEAPGLLTRMFSRRR